MFCYKCGAKLDDGAKFCRQCGTEIYIPCEKTTSTDKYVKTNRKKGKKILILLASIVVVVLAATTLFGRGTTVTETQIDVQSAPISIETSRKEEVTTESNSKSNTKNCPVEIVAQKSTGTEYGYSHAAFTVKNVSGETIHTLTLDIKILDENKTVLSTTHPQEGVRIADGESITIEALTKEGPYSMKLDGYSFYTGEDFEGDYIQGFFSVTEEVVLD